MAIRATQAAKQRHHVLSIAKRQVRFEYEACVPASGGDLEALVLLVGHLAEQQQGIREHHKHMFVYMPCPDGETKDVDRPGIDVRLPVSTGLICARDRNPVAGRERHEGVPLTNAARNLWIPTLMRIVILGPARPPAHPTGATHH